MNRQNEQFYIRGKKRENNNTYSQLRKGMCLQSLDEGSLSSEVFTIDLHTPPPPWAIITQKSFHPAAAPHLQTLREQAGELIQLT